MKKMNLPNITLMASVASIFIQIGAQMYALVVIASTIVRAPPRSFAIFEGEYGSSDQFHAVNHRLDHEL
jgi:hypothetical protein